MGWNATDVPIVPASEIYAVLERLGRLTLSGFPYVNIPTPPWLVDSRGIRQTITLISTVLQRLRDSYLEMFPARKTDEAFCSSGKLISRGGRWT